ncbi:glycerate kinase [Marinobacter fuscus]|uniref:Glycerate kinase n=1 Tax=Marinobacter fuscus TaxID=2109942 RepID=A0A2T1KT96_9GAMM|nr:glycerate kinase [Marinobacter fuscus]PSF13280.1 glycerate kinase [Marinobacter fuscus]
MRVLPEKPDVKDPASVSGWLKQLADVAVSAVHPDTLFSPDQLPARPPGRTVVIGAGKGAAAMAAAFERAWEAAGNDAGLTGLVVTRYGHGADCRHIQVLEASHPMPDELGEKAARQMLEAVRDLGEDDLVVALVSGGGSALMTLPAEGLTLPQKQAINRALLRCGAPIREINTVRRHLSAIKGGRLVVAAHPAKVVTYLISDVPGDDPTLIASGPTLPDNTQPRDALEILERYGIEIPDEVRQHLISDDSAPAPDSPGFARDETIMLAKASDALDAATEAARGAGLDVRVLGDNLEGESRELGASHVAMALELQQQIDKPLLILSGGETSVTVLGEGRGGRNAEYLLGAYTALKGAPGVHVLAIDTDGIDGSEDNAGASFGPEDWSSSLSPEQYLARNDAYGFFEQLDRLIFTGPTRTNVNDFRAILVLPRNP